MLEALRERGRLKPTAFLFVISAFCVALSILRAIFTGTHEYLFLNWNLILAFLPWLFTSFAILGRLKNRLAILIIMAVWLLFFPNSLYMLTDLIHLREIADAPVWLDLIIVLSFAWAGLCYGFVSLADIEHLLKERFHAGARTVAVLSALMIYVAAFGVYIGRFLRWNSWDFLGNPAALMSDIYDRFADPGNNLRIFGFTVLMGTLLNFMHFPIRYLDRRWADEKRS